MRIRPLLAIFWLALGAASGTGAGVIGYSWHKDGLTLKAIALRVTSDRVGTPAKIAQLNDWVYHNQGFAKNNEYFLVQPLGPTPTQVLQSGGDCADKSRLLSAMLAQIGIRSGLVMLFPCKDCDPIHTVVEAKAGGGRMVADPVWDVDYAYSVEELAGSQRGAERVATLKQSRPAGDKIFVMPETEWTFDHARAINFDKNAMTRTTARILTMIGVNPKTLFRPSLLEDPKLLLMTGLSLASAMFFLLAIVFWRLPEFFADHAGPRTASPNWGERA